MNISKGILLNHPPNLSALSYSFGCYIIPLHFYIVIWYLLLPLFFIPFTFPSMVIFNMPSPLITCSSQFIFLFFFPLFVKSPHYFFISYPILLYLIPPHIHVYIASNLLSSSFLLVLKYIS